MIMTGRSGKMMEDEFQGRSLLHLRLVFAANFPWSVNMQEFNKALFSKLFLRETNFHVNKEMTCVSARLYFSEIFQFFAMTEMLKKLFLLSASYQKGSKDTKNTTVRC